MQIYILKVDFFFLRHTTVIKKLELVLFSAAHRRWQKWAQQKLPLLLRNKKKNLFERVSYLQKQPFVFRFI